MHELPHQLQAIAAGQRNLITRRQLHDIGWTDTRTKAAVRQGWLRPLHPGVYLLGSAPPDWWQRLLAAVLAAGDGAFVSHRAALLLWGLVSWTTAPIDQRTAQRPAPAERGPPPPQPAYGTPVGRQWDPGVERGAHLARVDDGCAARRGRRRRFPPPGAGT